MRPDRPLSLVSLAFAGLLFSLPFLAWNHLPPLAGFYPEWWAGVCGLMVLVILLDGISWQRIPMIALAPLFLALVLAIQWLSGRAIYPTQFTEGIAFLLWTALLMIAGQALARQFSSKTIATSLGWALVLGGLINSVAAVLQHWQIHTLFDPFVVATKSGSPACGNLAQSNHLADYLGLGLASLLYLRAYTGVPFVVALTLASVLLFGLSLTASRSAWLYLISLNFLAIGWHLNQRSSATRSLIRLTLTTLPLFLALQLFLPLLSYTATADERIVVGSGMHVRLSLLRHAWQMFLAHPWLGVGYQHFAWNNFLLSAHDARQGAIAPEFHITSFSNAHNLPLQLLAEFGMGGLATVGLLGYWFCSRLRQQWSPERWWAWALLTVLGIHSLVEYPLWYDYFLGIAALVSGFLDNPTESRFHLTPRLGQLATVLALLGGGALLAITLQGYEPLQRVFTFDSRPQSGYTSVHLRTDLSRANASGFFAPQIEFFYSTLPIDSNAQRTWPILLKFNTRVAYLTPNSGLLYRRALLLALTGQPERAEQLLRDTVSLFPEDLPTFLQNLSGFGLNQPGVRKLYGVGLSLQSRKPDQGMHDHAE